MAKKEGEVRCTRYAKIARECMKVVNVQCAGLQIMLLSGRGR